MSLRRTKRCLAVTVSSTALLLGVLAAVPAQAAPAAESPQIDTTAGDEIQGERRPGDRKRARKAAPAPAEAAGRADTSARAAADGPASRSVRLTEQNLNNTADPGLQLASVEVTQDLVNGRLSATAVMRAVPGTLAAVHAIVGTWSGGTCETTAAVVVATTTDFAGGHVGGSPITATRSASGASLTGASTSHHDAIRAGEWDCAYAVVTDAAGDTAYHSLFAESLVDHYAPDLAIDLGKRVQGNYRGKWTKMRVEVFNASRSDATGVTVIPKGKGLTFKPKSISVGDIGGRSTEYGLEFQVRLKGKKPKKKQRKATFVASTAGASFSKNVTIAEQPRPKKYKSLKGRYFWGFLPASVDEGWQTRAVWFVDGKWAHVGFAKNGKKPKCSKKVKACKRYKYNKRKGVVRFGGKKAKVNTEGFRMKVAKKEPKASFYPATLAKRKQRFDVQLMRNDFTGFCGIWCTTSTEWLSMDKNGRFVLSGMTIGSLGPPGVGSIVGVMPPDEHGTYKVGKGGRVVLSYASGKKERHTLAIDHDIRGKASPKGAGLVLGERNFYDG